MFMMIFVVYDNICGRAPAFPPLRIFDPADFLR
jgi:hypothetical protein